MVNCKYKIQSLINSTCNSSSMIFKHYLYVPNIEQNVCLVLDYAIYPTNQNQLILLSVIYLTIIFYVIYIHYIY